MWPLTFDDRFKSWNCLRDQAKSLPPEPALTLINRWWFNCPWKPYYLHWDDIRDWPDPWQLLSDNYYCDVARGLGIVYTITLLDREDLLPVELVLTEDDLNLVLVGKEKYILNWDRDLIVNTNLEVKTKYKLLHETVKQQYL